MPKIKQTLDHSTETLDHSTETLDHLLDSGIINLTSDAVIQIDEQGNLLQWSQQAEKIFGWKKKETVGRLLCDVIIPKRYRDELVKGLTKCLEIGAEKLLSQRFESIGLHSDGHEFPIEFTLTVKALESQKEINASIRDITKQKQDILALRLSEERYRALFDKSRDALMTLSLTRGFLSGNNAAIKLFACKNEEEFLSQSPAFLSPEFQENGASSEAQARANIEKAMEKGSYGFEWLHQKVNGQVFYAEVQLSRINIQDEALIQASVRDITEFKNTSRAAKHAEFLNEQALDLARAGCWQIDYNQNSDYYISSERTVEIFGDLPKENFRYHIIHDWYANIEQADIKLAAETIANYQAALEGTIPRYDMIHPYKRPIDGKIIWIHGLGQVVYDNLGNPAFMYGVVMDVTASKLAEIAISESWNIAEQAAKAKGDFLANMSHEIRTPLNAIIGLTKILQRDNQAEHLCENINRINEASLHLLNLVNDILDFSKIEIGKMTLDQQAFKLMDLVTDVMSLVELRAREKNLILKMESDVHLPAWVKGDSLRLRQILVNLLSNAVKFTQQGQVVLSIRPLEGKNSTIEFSITDSGIGMSPEQCRRLFAAFEQADNSTTRKFGGTGLGLAISQNLAMIMGGEILVSSELGVGSKFILQVPLPATTPRQEHQLESHQTGLRLKGLRILAAEDVELNRVVLEDLLVHENAQVIFAENGQVAIDRLKEFGVKGFDAVLMDVQMPIMDGYQATREILKLAPLLPIIGLTAHALPEERQRCLDAGMRELVTKPIDTDLLVATINLYVGGGSPIPPQIKTESPAHFVTTNDATEDKVQLINWQSLHRRYKNRPAFIDTLINNTLNETHHDYVHKLRQAAIERDYTSIIFIAHNLKTLAGVFESQIFLGRAQQTEASAKNKQESATTLGIQLANTLELFLAELKTPSRKKRDS